MKTIRHFILAAAVLALASCSSAGDNDNIGNEPVAVRVTANIDGIGTRAVDGTWENADAIGISTVTAGAATQYANMKYATSSDKLGDFTYAGNATAMYLQKNEEVEFAAYYPFTGTEGTAAGAISNVKTDDQSKQKTFDFLFATGAKASKAAGATLSFTGENAFKHEMTRLVINIQADAASGFTADDMTGAAYTLGGVKHSGTFNTATGEAAATGDATADWTITPTSAGNQLTSSMILYPQSGATLTFKATIGGVTYSCNITPALAAGTSYTYTITVKKTGLQVSNCSISGWGNGGTSTGDATM